MATVNRYTQTSTPRYNPRTLQELMMAPMYKREQHDKAAERIGVAETELAKLDSLGLHDDVLKEERAKLDADLQAQADMLESEGFSQSAKSDFLSFNKKYQDSIGPKGTIGKIGSALASWENEKATIMANATAMKYGPDQVKAKLDEAYAKYANEFAETGDIKDFVGPMPPAHEDLQKDILTIGQAMGSDTITRNKERGYKIDIDENGLFAITSRSGAVIQTDQESQLGKALKMLNDKWTGEGLGAQSAEWQGLDEETIATQIANGLGLQTSSTVLDKRTESYQFMAIPKAKADKEGVPLTFIRQKIPGFNSNGISPNSPLLALDKVRNVNFDIDGNLEKGASDETYEQQIDRMNKELTGPGSNGAFIEFNGETGLYDLYTQIGKEGAESYAVEPIFKTGYQIKGELDKIRTDNPGLRNISDKDLIEKMQAFKEDLASNYVEEVKIPGQSFEWLNDDLFGSRKGTGEQGAGSIQSLGVTLAGKEYTYDEVYKELGYDTAKEMRDGQEGGRPTVNSYVPILGKYKATVYDKDGNSHNMFIEGPEEINNHTQISRNAMTALVAGESFARLDNVQLSPGYYAYVINDFTTGPKIIYSQNSQAQTAADLIDMSPQLGRNNNETVALNEGDEVHDFLNIYKFEEATLLMSPVYQNMIGLDKTNK